MVSTGCPKAPLLVSLPFFATKMPRVLVPSIPSQSVSAPSPARSGPATGLHSQPSFWMPLTSNHPVWHCERAERNGGRGVADRVGVGQRDAEAAHPAGAAVGEHRVLAARVLERLVDAAVAVVVEAVADLDWGWCSRPNRPRCTARLPLHV
jgi:hypothetical protein